jgi:glutathione S-transferase
MTSTRRIIHAAFLLMLPIIVAWFGLGVFTAVAAVIAMLLWRWLIVLSGFVAPEKAPDLVLETISASHFVEKVRWCMDRMQLEYTEHQNAGIIGVLFTGRTVPQLKVKTGIVQSVIGNSSDILRYLWGTTSTEQRETAEFLEPTQERLDLERRIDRYGRDLQVWVYYHLLHDRKLALQAWGINAPAVPRWQRVIARLLFPLLATFLRMSFSITDTHYARVVHNIEDLLTDIDTRLADGRRSILGGDQSNYTDIAFASMTGLWLQPKAYGGGQAAFARLERDQLPEKMRSDITRWIEDHPKAITLVDTLYAEERQNDT